MRATKALIWLMRSGVNALIGLPRNATGNAGRATGTGLSGSRSYRRPASCPPAAFLAARNPRRRRMQPLFASAPWPARVRGGKSQVEAVARRKRPAPVHGARAGAEWPGSKTFPAVCMRGAPRPGSTGPKGVSAEQRQFGDTLKLQHPLHNDVLRIVERGEKRTACKRGPTGSPLPNPYKRDCLGFADAVIRRRRRKRRDVSCRSRN
jgi:hypothetical protein